MGIAALFRQLGEILVHERLTTPDLVERALARSRTTGERVGEALVALGAIKDDDVLRALAVQQGLAYLTRDELPSPLPIVKNLSPKYLRQYTVCPVSVEGNVLTVATADPLNPVIVDDLAQSTGLAVKVVVSSADAIGEAIDRTFDGVATPLQRIVEGMEDDRAEGGDEDVDHLRDMAFEAPVVRLVNLLIEGAIGAEASDIHIEPFEDTLRIRYRIDGILYDQEAPPRRLQAAVTSRVKLMAEMNIAERRLPQDGRIRVTMHGRRVDIRVSTIPTVHGESIVMRLLDRQSVFLPLEKLGFGPAMLPGFESMIRRPHGIVLVTGPTGSGKTTTLYAALDKINSPDRKIITVEDPVEYQLKGVNQIPVKPKIGLTFATGLRHIVRQDPDVILIGEVRDLETADIAIQASLTGHLVFSTLHTNDAPGAITRLQDMGVEPYLVASVLEGVMAQRLVRRICAACRATDSPSAGDLGALGIAGTAGVPLYRGRGCDECRGTGYRGRTGIYELFPITEDARSLILRRAPTREIRRAAVEAGMITLRLDGWAKACEGVTTVEEILRVTQEDA
ncbi:MAG: type II secretion system protein GspE [Candidatus Rokuibacteriota bacterium]|nr:MAG: type II secretion system protein GspE [Candidatus Rokubacteria bacterium]PYN56695.1 MAG: type II secretion system protein GspE [Candidatus Rokubacteria bacterium]